MTSRPPAQCMSCRHWTSPLDRDDDDAKSAEPTQVCAAFPAGIPDDIWWNRFDHRKPYPGDGGIHWEAVEGAEFPDWAMNT